MKLFVTDFDRTLYVDRDISLKDINSIKSWQEDGNLFVIATGRDIYSVREKVELYDIQPDYWICNNGAVLFDEKFNVLSSKVIEREVLMKILEYIYENYEGAFSLSEVNSKIAVRAKNDQCNERDYRKMIDFSEIEKIGEVYQIHKRFDEESLVSKLANDLNDKYGNYITAYPNNLNVDIVTNGVNKSGTVEYLKNSLNNVNKVITIGDSYNDLQMILDYGGYTLESANENIRLKVKNICVDVSECIYINN